MPRKSPSLAPLLMALTVLGLGIFIWVYESKRPTTDEANEQRARLLPGLKPEWIERLHFHSTAHDYALARRTPSGSARKSEDLGDPGRIKWDLTAPLSARAESGSAGALMDRLVELDVVRPVGEPAVDKKVYGLDPPAGVITLALAPDASSRNLPRAVELKIGGLTPFPGERYLAGPGGAIVVIAGGLLEGFELDPATLRDRRLLDLESAEVEKIEISRDGKVTAALSRGKSRWEFTAPVADWAAEGDADAFMNGLQFLNAEKFIDDAPADLARYGLASPAARVTFTSKTGAQWLEAGAEAGADPAASAPASSPAPPPRPLRYARSSLSPAVLRVEAGALEKLLAAAPIRRDPALLPLKQWVRIQFDDGPAFTLEGTGGERKWRCAGAPKGKTVAQSLLSNRLETLQQLQVKDFGGTLAGHESEFGLDHPAHHLRLTGEDKTAVELKLGKAGPGGFWLALGGRPAALLIDANAAAIFSTDGAEFLRDDPAASAPKSSAASSAAAH